MSRRILLITVVLAVPVRADDTTDALAKELRDYATAELAKVPGKDGKYSTALPDYLRKQIQDANRRDRDAWTEVRTREDWERFRDERIAALRTSLGTFPKPPAEVPAHTTKTIETGDYAIENLLYESRPGVWVTGNLYRPTAKRDRMPVILIVHSHHAPKHQGELQDMGVTWARLGCMVLVIDQLGHGERRQHPFADAKDYPKEFRVGRQDYYFRYNLNLQLSLVGDSLMGWMVWDLMRGLDVVLARPGADKERVILLGSVAGGGDPAAVTAALDARVKCVVPFNFGGPQPETRYPLPDDAETSFNYAGSGSWESTRNLRDSAAKGFLPWVIVASVAPRKVIHAHEFSWDRDRDPVWKRYQKVWGLYDATDSLSFTSGTGVIQGNDPTASHCTNIGPIHRKGIYAALKKWFDIPVPEKESKERRSAGELACWTDEAIRELKPKAMHEVLSGMAERQQASASLRTMEPGRWPPESLGTAFRIPTQGFLGWPEVRPATIPLGCDSCWLTWSPTRIPVRGLALSPRRAKLSARQPVVVCVCQDGPYRFLVERSTAAATLLRSGICVFLPELPGTGRDRPGHGRDRTSGATALSATMQMTGQSSAGIRAADLNFAIGVLNQIDGLDRERIVLWGESLSGANEQGAPISVQLDLSQPRHAEPLEATLAAAVSVKNSRVKAVVARGGLVSYRSVLDSPFVHIPHDALPVNVFRAGDMPDVWAALAPKPLRLEGLVDGTNRRVSGEQLEKALKPVTEAYKKGGLVVKEDYTPDAELAKWIVEQLKK